MAKTKPYAVKNQLSATVTLDIPGDRHVALDVLLAHLATACQGISLYGYTELIVDATGCVYIDDALVYEPKTRPS